MLLFIIPKRDPETKRYFLPRTAYCILGSFYFLLTLEIRIFLLTFMIEGGCIALVALTTGILSRSSLFMGFCLAKAFLPFFLHHSATLNCLRGAWKIDYLLPTICAMRGLTILFSLVMSLI